MAGLLPGGWPEVRERNHALAMAGRALLCDALAVDPPAPEEMIGSFAAVRLPDGDPTPPSSALYADPLQLDLLERHGIEVPIPPWPGPPRRLIRISAQLYNEIGHYERLVTALREQLRLDLLSAAHGVQLDLVALGQAAHVGARRAERAGHGADVAAVLVQELDEAARARAGRAGRSPPASAARSSSGRWAGRISLPSAIATAAASACSSSRMLSGQS